MTLSVQEKRRLVEFSIMEISNHALFVPQFLGFWHLAGIFITYTLQCNQITGGFSRNYLQQLMTGLGTVLQKEEFSIMAMNFDMT